MSILVTTTIKVNGKENCEKIRKYVSTNKYGEEGLYLNNVVEMPSIYKELHELIYLYEDNIRRDMPLSNTDILQDDIQLMLENFYKEGVSCEDFVESIIDETINNPYFKPSCDTEIYEEIGEAVIIGKTKSYWAYRTYGFIMPYQWAEANWGVPCETDYSYVSDFTDNMTFSIQTKDTLPLKVIEKLAQEGIEFTVASASEDFGDFCTILIVENGEIKPLELGLDERDVQILSCIICGSEEDLQYICEDEEEIQVASDRYDELFHQFIKYI